MKLDAINSNFLSILSNIAHKMFFSFFKLSSHFLQRIDFLNKHWLHIIIVIQISIIIIFNHSYHYHGVWMILSLKSLFFGNVLAWRNLYGGSLTFVVFAFLLIFWDRSPFFIFVRDFIFKLSFFEDLVIRLEGDMVYLAKKLPNSLFMYFDLSWRDIIILIHSNKINKKMTKQETESKTP